MIYIARQPQGIQMAWDLLQYICLQELVYLYTYACKDRLECAFKSSGYSLCHSLDMADMTQTET